MNGASIGPSAFDGLLINRPTDNDRIRLFRYFPDPMGAPLNGLERTIYGGTGFCEVAGTLLCHEDTIL